MPGRDITHLPNRATKFLFLLALVVLNAIPLRPQAAPATRSSQAPGNSQAAPSQSSSPSQAGTPASSAPAQQEPNPKSEQGVFVFRKDVDEVLLHASVIDDHQHIVTDLGRDAFTVSRTASRRIFSRFTTRIFRWRWAL